MVVTILVCVLFCCNAFAGLGEPISCDSLSSREREALLSELSKSEVIEAVSDVLGEESVRATFERLPDGDLNALAQNLDTVVSGGMTMGEVIAQLVIFCAILGVLIILLIVLGVTALFAGGVAASSGKRGAPMGKAQYDEQRRKVEDTKEIAKPAEQGE
jgi:hypothetical protein